MGRYAVVRPGLPAVLLITNATQHSHVTSAVPTRHFNSHPSAWPASGQQVHYSMPCYGVMPLMHRRYPILSPLLAAMDG